MSSASATAAISSQRAWPEYICVRVRGCSVSTRAPASWQRSAIVTGSRISSFQPLRILHVTGRCVLRDDGADHLLHEIEILEAAGAAVAPDDLLHRAAEVDVDELGLENVGHEARRLAHRRGIGAEDLHADRPLVGAEAQLVEGRLVLAPDAFGGEELRHDDVRAKRRQSRRKGDSDTPAIGAR